LWVGSFLDGNFFYRFAPLYVLYVKSKQSYQNNMDKKSHFL
jgi:hypothetical protein